MPALYVPLVLAACAGPAAQPWGPETATPGTHLELMEASRDPAPSGHGNELIRYKLTVTGLPTGKSYKLWVKRSTDRAPIEAAPIQLRPDGHSEAMFLAHDYAKGESIGAEVISDDRTVVAYGEAYPYPLEARDGACRLALTLRSPNGEVFSAEGSGFPPASQVQIAMRSGDEVMAPFTQAVDAGGSIRWVVLPAAKGEHRASIAIKGDRCGMKLDYVWGEEAVRAPN